MNAGSFLATATLQLEAAGIATARLDALVLLEDALNTNRAQILADPDLLITTSQLNQLQKQLARRARHVPLAYIRNRTEFYGRTFFVDERVLEPRPESEAMIELLASKVKQQDNTTIIDVGTGSGALAITAKLELPNATAVGIDIDPGCLAVARRNAKTLCADITWLEGDLLRPVTKNYKLKTQNYILLCNLPYVPDNFRINTAAMHEPRLAIFGGNDGLDVYRKLFRQITDEVSRPVLVLTESMPPQHDLLTNIAGSAGYVLDGSADFIQVFRTATGSSEL
jgi:release factor glutamine methyltransferase